MILYILCCALCVSDYRDISRVKAVRAMSHSFQLDPRMYCIVLYLKVPPIVAQFIVPSYRNQEFLLLQY